MKPICVKCQRFYRAKKNGYYFIEGMPGPGQQRALPGIQEPERWEPYKLWVGDLYECQGCGHQLVSGVSREPLTIHHEDRFETLLKLYQPELQVNDC